MHSLIPTALSTRCGALQGACESIVTAVTVKISKCKAHSRHQRLDRKILPVANSATNSLPGVAKTWLGRSASVRPSPTEVLGTAKEVIKIPFDGMLVFAV